VAEAEEAAAEAEEEEAPVALLKKLSVKRRGGFGEKQRDDN